jgi:hypothetical protein
MRVFVVRISKVSVMRNVGLSLLLLLASGCGSSPTGPSTTGNENLPRPVAVALSLLSIGGTAQGGLGSPLSVTLSAGALGPESPGTLEAVTFKVTGADGTTLADARVTTSVPVPARVGGSGQTAKVSTTLTWPIEKGYGKRVDVTLTIRDANGAIQTLSFSSPR